MRGREPETMRRWREAMAALGRAAQGRVRRLDDVDVALIVVLTLILVGCLMVGGVP